MLRILDSICHRISWIKFKQYLVTIVDTIPISIFLERISIVFVDLITVFERITIGIVAVRICFEFNLVLVVQSVLVAVCICIRHTLCYRIILSRVCVCYVNFLIVGQTVFICIGKCLVCTEHLLIQISQTVFVCIKQLC